MNISFKVFVSSFISYSALGLGASFCVTFFGVTVFGVTFYFGVYF